MLTLGSKATFLSSTISNASMCEMTSTTFVIGSYSGTNGCVVAVGTVSGTTISYGSTYSYYSGTGLGVKLLRLTDTTFVILYSGSGSNLFAKVGTISGTSISFGSEYTIATYNADNITQIDATLLSSTSFVTSYRDDDGAQYRGSLKVCTVSSTVITVGTRYQFQYAASIYKSSIQSLSSSSFILAYADSDNSYQGTARICSVSGTTITLNTKYVYATTNYSQNPVDIAFLSSSSVGIFYGTSRGIIASISGTTISYGAEYSYNSNANVTNLAVLGMSSSSIVLADFNSTGSESNCRTVSVSGTVITYDSPTIFISGGTTFINLGKLSSNSFVISFADYIPSQAAKIGVISAPGKKINGVTLIKWNGVAITK